MDQEQETEKNHARTAAKHFQEISKALDDIFPSKSLNKLDIQKKECLHHLISGLEELAFAALVMQQGIDAQKDS